MGIEDGKVVRDVKAKKVDMNADVGSIGRGGRMQRQVSFFFNDGGSDTLTAQKSAYGCSFGLDFGKVETHVSAGEFIIKMPVRYSLIKGESPFPEQYDGQSLYSFLRLKFTLEGQKLFCRLKCDSLPELKNYDLQNLLFILYPSLSQSGMAYSVTDKHDLLFCVTEPVHVRQVVTHERVDSVEVETFVKIIKEYRLHCLRRFEELTVTRDGLAYQCSLQLGDILDKIATDYHSVTDLEYKNAYKKISALELNETYQNDPQIFMSLNGIREALSFFRHHSKMAAKGVEIDLHQLKLIVNELENHEGNRPKDDIWFPLGTALNFSLQMEEFCGYEIMQHHLIL